MACWRYFSNLEASHHGDKDISRKEVDAIWSRGLAIVACMQGSAAAPTLPATAHDEAIEATLPLPIQSLDPELIRHNTAYVEAVGRVPRGVVFRHFRVKVPCDGCESLSIRLNAVGGMALPDIGRNAVELHIRQGRPCAPPGGGIGELPAPEGQMSATMESASPGSPPVPPGGGVLSIAIDSPCAGVWYAAVGSLHSLPPAWRLCLTIRGGLIGEAYAPPRLLRGYNDSYKTKEAWHTISNPITAMIMGPERREVAHLVFHALDIDRCGSNKWEHLLETIKLASISGSSIHHELVDRGERALNKRSIYELAIDFAKAEQAEEDPDEMGGGMRGCGLSSFYRLIHSLYGSAGPEEFEETIDILHTSSRIVGFDASGNRHHELRQGLVSELAEKQESIAAKRSSIA